MAAKRHTGTVNLLEQRKQLLYCRRKSYLNTNKIAITTTYMNFCLEHKYIRWNYNLLWVGFLGGLKVLIVKVKIEKRLGFVFLMGCTSSSTETWRRVQTFISCSTDPSRRDFPTFIYYCRMVFPEIQCKLNFCSDLYLTDAITNLLCLKQQTCKQNFFWETVLW